MVNWKHEGKRKRGCKRRNWKDGIYTAMGERDMRVGEWNSGIYTAMGERDLKMGEWNSVIYIAMGERDLRLGEWNYRRQWNMEVGRRRQAF